MQATAVVGLFVFEQIVKVVAGMGSVLIIEDYLASREFLTELVQQSGRDVVTANDGQDALERIKSIPPPCLILLDLAMPRMNGREFLRRKNADVSIAGVPTIVVSAFAGV